MKQIIKIGVLGLCALIFMGSCKKKGGEPIPPTVIPDQGGKNTNNGIGDSNTPIDNTKGIKLILSPKETSFSLSEFKGEGLFIEGAKTTREGKTISITANQAGATIILKGNVNSLSISSGRFESIDFSQAPTTLKKIIIRNISSKSPLDLSTLLSLEEVRVFKAGLITLPKNLKIIDLNENNTTNDFTLESFPNLEELYLIGTYFNKNVNFKGSTKLKKFSNSRCATPTIDLSNCPSLTGVLLRDMNGTTKVDLSGTKLLKEGEAKRLTNFSGFSTDTGNDKLKSLNLSGASFTNFNNQVCKFTSITYLNLRGNKLATANFSAFSQLVELDLTENPTLTGNNLTQVLQSLPKKSGAKLKINSLSNSDRQIVTDKGWTIADN